MSITDHEKPLLRPTEEVENPEIVFELIAESADLKPLDEYQPVCRVACIDGQSGMFGLSRPED